MKQSYQTTFFQALKQLFSTNKELPVVPVTMIWYRVKTAKAWQLSISEGDNVLIIGDKLCNCHDSPTHKITSLRQRSNGTGKEISCISLKDHSLKRIFL